MWANKKPDTLQPATMGECRYRRLLLAEGAEIRKNTEFVESDQRDQEREAAGRIWRCSLLGG